MRAIILAIIMILVPFSTILSFEENDMLEDIPSKSSNSGMSNSLGSFNGTIPYPLNTEYLDFDTFPDMTYGANLEPRVQDFLQLKNGSYMILVTTDSSGTFTNGESFYDGDNALIMLNPDGEMINVKTYSNHVGSSLSGLFGLTGIGFFHAYGAHTLINLDEEYVVLAGTLGYQNYQYQSFGGVINSSTMGEHIFVAKVNLSTFEIDSHTIFYTVGGNSNQHCKVAVFEESFVDSTTFKIVVTSYVESTNPRCNSISIGGTSYSAASILSTNILVTMDHNLSVINSIEVPSGDNAQSTPILLENGYAVLREYWVNGDDKLRVLAPGSNSWSTVNTNCETIRNIVALNNESIFFLCAYLDGSISGSPTIYPVYFHAYNTTSGTMSDQHIGYTDAWASYTFKSGYIAIESDRILVTFTDMAFTTLTNIRFYETSTIEVNLTSNVSTIFQQGYVPFVSGASDEAPRRVDDLLLRRPMFRGESSLMILKGNSFAAKYENLKILEIDTDIDGYADRIDAFPFEQSQWSDVDGDGYGDNPVGILADDCPSQAGNSTLDFLGCVDTDGDGQSNQGDLFPIDATQISDLDSDGYGDNMSGLRGDSCPHQYGESNRNGTYGCPDTDFDGWADNQDYFPAESSQWLDTDGDGFGDQYNGFEGDACPTISGTSNQDTFGCPDSDGDGWSDNGDDLPTEVTQWKDADGDGYGDNQSSGANLVDQFPNDATQWNDTDGDGYGDNKYGSQGDKFPLDPNRWKDTDDDGYADEDDAFPNDRTQWNDTDGDGHGDNPFGIEADKFPNDAGNWSDIDDDGYADDYDAFPSDMTQWNDTDSDGYGDELFGNRGDACPDEYGNSTADMFGCIDTDGDGVSDANDAFDDDPSRWQDTDGDGYGDLEDPFPFDPTQWADTDGDGMGDNPMGIGADKFPDDPTQWGDIDGDGYGDNSTGNNADAFITDPTQWSDVDGDGYGDNLAGRLPDLFPNNPTQWEDLDGDGLGDNQNGTDADPYLNDFDNDGYNDSIDILPKLASPNDLDNDGCLDDVDLFPDNFNECFDNDGDGIGDNSDTDDDNDGWSDMDEERLGTDVYSENSVPVDSFEIVLPGTTIGLGAWDLIGIFGGVPFFTWLAFCLVTRGARSRKLERSLFEARSELELSEISDKYEWALLWKLIGPHQALRLERIRSNLEFNMNKIEEEMKEEGFVPVSDVIIPPSIDAQGVVNTDGYEWIKHEGVNWYRVPNSNADWIKWQ